MPQIWPMNWLFLFFLFIVILLIFFSLNYFLMNPVNTEAHSIKNINHKPLNWQW